MENLMTSHDFRIIGRGVGNIKFVNLVAKDGGCEGNATMLVRTLEDTLEQNF